MALRNGAELTVSEVRSPCLLETQLVFAKFISAPDRMLKPIKQLTFTGWKSNKMQRFGNSPLSSSQIDAPATANYAELFNFSQHLLCSFICRLLAMWKWSSHSSLLPVVPGWSLKLPGMKGKGKLAEPPTPLLLLLPLLCLYSRTQRSLLCLALHWEEHTGLVI